MTNSIECTFKIESWEETPFSEEKEGPKLAQASVSQSYSGGIEGTGILNYLITTFDETFSRFIGIERVVGRLDDRKGSFVLDHEGTHENGVAKSSFRIVPDSGTGELSGIRGEGSFEATHEKATLTLEYDFE